MNERIEAFAKQAAEYAIEFAVKDQELYIPKLMEKFAELIVRECINEIHVADVGELKGKSYYLDKVAEHIEKHFGVDG